MIKLALFVIAVAVGLYSVVSLCKIIDHTECSYNPTPKPEDIRLCAPAPYDGIDCMKRIGYVRTCVVKEDK